MSAKKEDGKAQHMDIKLKDQGGNEVYFKVLPTTPFRKVIAAYCSRTGQQEHMIRLLYDGDEVSKEQTPGELGMEDEDTIDVMVAQTGGC